MRLRWLIAAMLLACQVMCLLQGANAQDKGKDKGPRAAQKPTLTPRLGEQKKAVAVVLKCATPNAVIRYTLDGSTPTADSGTVYADPIKVENTTTITAVSFANDLTPSQPMVGTYLFSPKEGLGTFHIGNSLTNTTSKFAEFVRTAGVVHQYRSFTAGGHLTWQLWDNQLLKRQKEWDGHLAAYKGIDHVTVQPRDFTKNSVDHEADSYESKT
jgi:Chitobiase/beta-hexosaminidase C-terminal domain